MLPIRISNFGGVVPRFANRLLPNSGARLAANCSLLSGELRPMRKPKKVYEPAAAIDLKSIFNVDSATWFCWPTEFVEMVRSPIEGEARYCFTGDGVPKITTKTLGTPVSASGTPAAARALGIPTPVAAPGLGQSGGTGSASSRFYVYTFYSDWNEESAPSAVSAFITGKVDSTWTVSGMDAAPPNSGSVTAVSKTANTVTVTLGAANHYSRADDTLTFAGVVGMTDLNGIWPVLSATAATVTISLTTAQTYTSGGTWARVNPWGACTKRIYRTSSGFKADFQLVAKDVTTSSYVDTLTDQSILGDSLISTKWVPPPTNLKGLVILSNGVLAGFYDNTVCMSEPYQPHAWPTAYRKKMASTVVGISAFDTNIGVATQGNPVVLSGSDPSVMLPILHNEPLPCVSRASVRGVGDGVIFSTKNGLAKMNLGGAGIFSGDLFGPEEWNDIGSSTLRSAYDGNKIYITTAAGTVYILQGNTLVTSTQLMEGMYADAGTGDVYFSYLKRVYLFDAFTSAPMTTDWWGREYVLPMPMNIGAVKVEYDPDYYAKALVAVAAEKADTIAGNVTKISTIGGRGSIGASAVNVRAINASALDPVNDGTVGVSFSFYAKETLIYSAILPNGQIATLPSGYKADTFSVRIQANTQVRAIVLGETPGSLRNA